MVGASRLLCGWLQFLDAGYAAAASSLWPARVGWHALSPRRAWLNCESRCPARSSQVGHAPHDRIRVGWHALSLRRAWLYCESRRPARPSLHNAPTPIAALWACHTMSCYRPNCRRTFDRIVTVEISVGWHALSLRRAWLNCESRRPARSSLHNASTPIATLCACHTTSKF